MHNKKCLEGCIWQPMEENCGIIVGIMISQGKPLIQRMFASLENNQSLKETSSKKELKLC